MESRVRVREFARRVIGRAPRFRRGDKRAADALTRPCQSAVDAVSNWTRANIEIMMFRFQSRAHSTHSTIRICIFGGPTRTQRDERFGACATTNHSLPLPEITAKRKIIVNVNIVILLISFYLFVHKTITSDSNRDAWPPRVRSGPGIWLR